MKKNLLLMGKGGLFGIANIIPGVSGGTMAVVLGFYEYLIEVIGNFLTRPEKRKEYVLFLAKLFSGAALAILVFSFIMDYLLTHYSIYTYLFFIGLILGSVPSVYRTHNDMRLTVSSIVFFLFGAVFLLIISYAFPAGHKGDADSVAQMHWTMNSWQALKLITAGFISGGSMIIPGVSGSFMLVLLGQYHVVIRAIKNMDILTLAVFGAGVVLGIIAFAKIMDWCFKKFPRQTMYFVLGLVLISVIPIFPGLPAGILGGIFALAVFIIGFLAAYGLGKFEAPGH
ncbi:MAG: DUF368 domain-containing protein [Calditrichia bacterium]